MLAEYSQLAFGGTCYVLSLKSPHLPRRCRRNLNRPRNVLARECPSERQARRRRHGHRRPRHRPGHSVRSSSRTSRSPTSATSTPAAPTRPRRQSPRRRERARRRSCTDFRRSSTTRASTSSSSPPATTGTPRPRSCLRRRQARLRREAVQPQPARRRADGRRPPASTSGTCRWATSAAAGRRSSRRWTSCARASSAASTSRSRGTPTTARRSARGKDGRSAEGARLRPLARPGAAPAVPRQLPALQLALVLALGQRRAGQQRRPHRSTCAAGASASTTRSASPPSGGRYRFEDDQETPDTHVVSFEFDGRKTITWEGLSCNQLPAGQAVPTCSSTARTGTLAHRRQRLHDLRPEGQGGREGAGAGERRQHFANFLDAIRGDGQAQQRDRGGAQEHAAVPPGQHRPPHRPSAAAATPKNGHILDDKDADGALDARVRQGLGTGNLK